MMVIVNLLSLSAILPILVSSSSLALSNEIATLRLNSSFESLSESSDLKEDLNFKVIDPVSTGKCNSSKSDLSNSQNSQNLTNITIMGTTAPRIFEWFDLLVVLRGAPSQALSCKVESKILAEIHWKCNQRILSSYNNSIIELRKDNTSYLIFPPMEKSYNGNYTCIATNEFGGMEQTVKVEVIEDKDIPQICNKSQDLENNLNAHTEPENQAIIRDKRFDWYHWVSFNQDLQNLVNLIAQRLLLADKVAVAKWDTNKPIEDGPREEIILQNVVKQAEATGLDPVWAAVFFRDQIEGNKDIQYGLFLEWRKQGSRPEGPPVDLEKDVRPLIDKINEDLISLSNKTGPIRGAEGCRYNVEQNARYTTFLYRLDYLHQEALQRAVSHLCVAQSSKY